MEYGSPGWQAKADQLLETAINSTMQMAAMFDHLDESEAVFLLGTKLIESRVGRDELAQMAAGVSIRLRRINNRAPIPSPE